MDYNKIFEIKEIKLEQLDKDTLINWNCLKLDNENWLVIEVWLDENNAIKILEQSEDDCMEISGIITEEQKQHIYKLVKLTLDNQNKLC